MEIKISPTFLLKGIDLNQLKNKYQQANYLVELSEKKEKITQVHLKNPYGKSALDPAFTYRNRDSDLTYFATNNGNSLTCLYCRYIFPEDYPKVALPIRLDQNIIHTFGSFCNYRCVLAFIRLEEEKKLSCQRSFIANLEPIVHHLYRESIKDSTAVLTPSAPFELASWNGGYLTFEEYHSVSPDQKYRRLSQYIFLSVKEQYLVKRESNHSSNLNTHVKL